MTNRCDISRITRTETPVLFVISENAPRRARGRPSATFFVTDVFAPYVESAKTGLFQHFLMVPLKKNDQTACYFTHHAYRDTCFFVISENAPRRARGRPSATFFVTVVFAPYVESAKTGLFQHFFLWCRSKK